MTILLFAAFVSGLFTILAPCIWPLLPVILSSSATGGRKKSLGITLGVVTSFALFTLTISYLVKIIPFDPDLLRLLAVLVIGFLGATLLIPKLGSLTEIFLSRFTSRLGNKPHQLFSSKNEFGTGLATGLSLGVVWSPCAGPILATIAALSVTQAVTANVVFITLAYAAGISLPLFAFAASGNYLFTRSRFLSPYTGRLRQIFGLVMILASIGIFTNYDKILQAKLLDFFPQYSNFLLKLENNKTVINKLDALKGKKELKEVKLPMRFPTLMTLPKLGRAPEFGGIYKWLNTDKPLTRESLQGKVVLVDFWTYTCINCIRTLPHVTGWYEKYKDKGFAVVGVHTPEFEFEKKTENVVSAIKQFKINYPVAQDNDYITWNLYDNHYWPAHYLIDAQGYIRKTHFGEGEYEETEKAIQELLTEAGQTAGTTLTEMPDETPKMRLSPETYLGSRRMAYFYPGGNLENGRKTFAFPLDTALHSFSLAGEWTITDEYSLSGQNASLNYRFFADKVFLVLKPEESFMSFSPKTIRVLLDNKEIDRENAGKDVENGKVTVDKDRLYELVNLKGQPGNHLLKLEFEAPGISAYAFTFG